jgi:SET domain-containing protein
LEQKQNKKSKPLMILPCLYIALTKSMGRGVFTAENIEEGTIVETSPVIIMSKDERKLLDQTRLHDYIFEWGVKKDECCMALGYVPVYNHSYRSNCEYEMDFEKEMITIKSVHFIKAGEELFINYNGNWNNDKPVWFETR